MSHVSAINYLAAAHAFESLSGKIKTALDGALIGKIQFENLDIRERVIVSLTACILEVLTTVPCPHCGKPKRLFNACPACGHTGEIVIGEITAAMRTLRQVRALLPSGPEFEGIMLSYAMREYINTLGVRASDPEAARASWPAEES
jgi:hypothetical protein